jgi:hypothetical protein
MKSVFDGYAPVNCQVGDCYFAGANTGGGFSSSYGDVANEDNLERVYIIKGSAGSGKSTLMKRIAEASRDAGYEVKYYLCGSDPFSLDSVVIDGRIAVLDGTPPHAVEMKYPAVKSEIVDLSQFLNSEWLSMRRDSIIEHTAGKNKEYASAYRYLDAAQRIEDGIMAQANSMFDHEKAAKFASRFARKLNLGKKSDGGRVRHRYSYAITMRGLFRVENSSDGWTVYEVVDYMRCAPILMSILAGEFVTHSLDVTLCHVPVSNHISEIALESLRVRIVTHRTDVTYGRINTQRFVREDAEPGLRGEIRLGAVIERSCISAASESLAAASAHHFALEEIYSSAMDFFRTDGVFDQLSKDIFTRLKSSPRV